MATETQSATGPALEEPSENETFAEQCTRFLDLDASIAPWNLETHPFGKSWEDFSAGLITPITAVGDFPNRFNAEDEWKIWGAVVKEKILGMKAENIDKIPDATAEMKKAE